MLDLISKAYQLSMTFAWLQMMLLAYSQAENMMDAKWKGLQDFYSAH